MSCQLKRLEALFQSIVFSLAETDELSIFLCYCLFPSYIVGPG